MGEKILFGMPPDRGRNFDLAYEDAFLVALHDLAEAHGMVASTRPKDMKSIQDINPYLRNPKARRKMTERVVRDSCRMEGMILPPLKKKIHRSLPRH